MPDYAKQLLSLTASLSQLNSREQMRDYFLEALNNIFKDCHFFWSEDDPRGSLPEIRVELFEKYYGTIRIKGDIHQENLELLNDAARVLALVFERAEHEILPPHHKKHPELLENESEFQLPKEEIQRQLAEYRRINEQLLIAKEKAEDNESRFRAIFENSQDAIGIELHGINLMANPAYLQMFRYASADEIVGKPTITHIAPHERDRIDEYTRKRAYDSNVPEFYESVGVRTNGEEFPFEIKIKSFLLNNEDYTLAIFRDISERQKSERELLATTAKLETLIQVSPLAIILLDTNGNIQIWNNAAEQIFGWTAGEVMGKANPIVPSDKMEEYKNYVTSLYEGEVLINEEAIRQRKDGVLIHVSISSSSLFDASNKVTGRMAIIADITEKKKTESELLKAKEKAEENEEWLRSIFSSANIGIAVTDKSGRWVSWNKTTNRIFGLTDEQMRQSSNLDITHPEDVEITRMKMNQIYNREIENYRIEKRYLKNDNSYWWADLAVSPILKNNEIVAFIGVASDITARKQYEQELIKSKEEAEKSEEKYRLLLENISDLVCEIDEDGLFTYLNNNYIEVLGYYPSELMGKAAIDLIHPDDLAESLKKYDKLKQSKGNSIDTWRFKHKNGAYRLFESKGKVFVNSENEISTVVISRDITLQKETEGELIRAKEKAEESDRLKTAFLQNMSHEIRTPMNAIIGFSQILTSKFDDKEKLKKFTGIISQRCADLLDIINDILDIAKIESGQVSVVKEKCDLFALFEELAVFFAAYQKKTGKENIRLSLQAEVTYPGRYIVTDSLKLKQIFINLLTNAFKFTEEGHIQGGCKYNENKQLVFFVTDTGMGIPLDKQKLIFERFSQLDHIAKRNIGGTGLGLSIVKGLVCLLGGEISLKSEPGKGSSFYFTIADK